MVQIKVRKPIRSGMTIIRGTEKMPLSKVRLT